MMWSAAVLFLLAGISFTSACDAPGDFDVGCRERGADQRNFPDDWVILLDTYDYESLIQGANAPWLNLNRDGDFSQFIQVGGACTSEAFVCGFRNQENWLISQYICYNNAREIYLNATYNLVRCPACAANYITICRQDADEKLSREDRININRYESHYQISQGSTNEITCLLRPPRSNGFYLGIKDNGTCGTLRRIIIYYTVCRGSQKGLVIYREVPNPPKDILNETFDAECVDHAHSVTSLQVDSISCIDVAVGGARCECDSGYKILNDKSCVACPPNTYHVPGLTSTCTPCPANSVAPNEASQKCNCLFGYFRTADESVAAACTRPPSKVRNLTTCSCTDKTITLCWLCPTFPGRDDLYYEICYQNLFTFSGRSCIRKTYDTCETSITLTNLDPNTPYDIYVFTLNGVSDQDEVNVGTRTVSTTVFTKEGVPNAPFLKRLCTVVIWKPPTEPNGVITAYELCFINSTGNRVCYSYTRTDNFHVTTKEQQRDNVQVQIRAKNSVNYSPWTPIDGIGCDKIVRECPIPSEIPPTISSAKPPTTPITVPPSTTTLPPTTAVPPTPISTCDAGNYCQLNGVPIVNGQRIVGTNIGVGDSAVQCFTNLPSCCKDSKQGQCYYPDGRIIGLRAGKGVLYRNRGTGMIRLNRRSSEPIPSGTYSCVIPNGSGIDCTLTFQIE